MRSLASLHAATKAAVKAKRQRETEAEAPPPKRPKPGPLKVKGAPNLYSLFQKFT